MDTKLNHKLNSLKNVIQGLESVITSFSGGVDSSLVAKVAQDVLGDRALAVTAVSPSYSKRERNETERFVASFNLRHEFIETEEVDDPRYRANPINRCYFCKDVLYKTLKKLAIKRGFLVIADGFNADDNSDHRPGRIAARQYGIRSPLSENGITKEEVRKLAAHLGLPTASKPALACLSSRIPYGTEVTPERLATIDAAEEILRNLKFVNVRVRWVPLPPSGRAAKIEVGVDELEKVIKYRDTIIEQLHSLGFHFITLDLEGFASGSLNKALRP